MDGPIEVEIRVRFERQRRKRWGLFGRRSWRAVVEAFAPNGEVLHRWYGQEIFDNVEAIEISSNMWKNLLMRVSE